MIKLRVAAEERIVKAPVVAALIKRPNGKIFLVKHKGRWTFLTGKFEWAKESDLRATLFREVREEAFGLRRKNRALINRIEKYFLSVQLLDALPLQFVEDVEDGGKQALVIVYIVEINEPGARRMRYEKSNKFCWTKPLLELTKGGFVEESGMPLDRLAKSALQKYFEKTELEKILK